MRMERNTGLRAIWRYAMHTRKVPMVGALLVVLLVAVYIFLTPNGKPRTDWWSWVEPVSGCATLAVAALVWYGELKQDWRNSLPKRLTVQFVFKPPSTDDYKVVMRCRDAYLAGEDDIRQWGQQLGLQMADNERLEFHPMVYVNEDPIRGNIRRYTATFVLSALPGKNHAETFQVSNGKQCDLHTDCLEMISNPETNLVEKIAINQEQWLQPKF